MSRFLHYSFSFQVPATTEERDAQADKKQQSDRKKVLCPLMDGWLWSCRGWSHVFFHLKSFFFVKCCNISLFTFLGI